MLKLYTEYKSSSSLPDLPGHQYPTNAKMSASNTAMVIRAPAGQAQTLSKESIPIPSLQANQVLVKISHVAQNPTDSEYASGHSYGMACTIHADTFTIVQSLDSQAFEDGNVLGCDFVGEVVELGSKVSRFSKGDVIAALVWGDKCWFFFSYI